MFFYEGLNILPLIFNNFIKQLKSDDENWTVKYQLIFAILKKNIKQTQNSNAMER